MTGYIFFILIISYFCFSPYKSINILIILILFSILREGVGWDYYSYLEVVELKMKGIESANYFRYTLPWQYLIDFSAIIKYPKLIVIIPSILTHSIIYITVRRIFTNSDNLVKLSLLVYALLPVFYLASFSTIRQWMAISVIFFSLTELNNNKLKKYVFLILIACIIHPSALFGFSAYFIKKFNWSLKSMIFYFLIAFLTSIIIIQILNQLTNLLGIQNIYLKTPDNAGKKILIILVFIAVYVLILRRRIIEMDYQLRLYTDAFLWGVILNISTAPYGGVISRVFYYLLICLVVVIPVTCKIFTKSSRQLVIMTFLIILISIFSLYLYTIRNVVNYGAGFFPYQIGL
jgi:hypothetical protein